MVPRPATLVRYAVLGSLVCALVAHAATGSPPGAAGTKKRAAAGRPATRKAPAPARNTRRPAQIAHDALDFEDQGLYARALEQLRALRPLVPPDGDLELATALDEARVGLVDSATARLATPLMDAATRDTLPTDRFRTYGAQRDPVLVDGRFDGWHWYVWRARAELALRRGRWDAVVADARRCIAARPASGKEYLLLAVAEGRLGHDADAAEAAHRAATLDTGLPEALYLDGLWAWRAGRRAEAQSRFRAAVATDPGYQPAGIALVRSRLAGVAPDSLPAAFLTGGRQAAMITSPVGPKIEQFVQLDHPAIIGHKVDPVVPDSLKKYFARFNLPVWVLVDENGRVVTSEIGWFDPAVVPVSVVADLVGDLPFWTFVPAQVAGMPRRVWVDLLYQFPL